jgi:Holliday junction resolvase
VQALVEKVKRLDIGLPVEDEFIAVCSWLGKCSLIHKLDQQQLPEKSKGTYQVPDALALFSTQSTQTPVLIEIKSKARQTLSFSGEYVAKLERYSALVGMPVLVAWKFNGLWVLFELQQMKKAKSNFNISYSEALQNSLMCALAGDFAYKVGAGAGIRLRFKKEQLVSAEATSDGSSEQWMTRVDRAEFTDRLNNVRTDLSEDVRSVLMTWNLEERQYDTESHVQLDYVAGEEGIDFAHRSLVRILQWDLQDDARPQWRQALRTSRINDSIKRFRHAVDEALHENVVSLILDLKPHTMPNFLPPEVDPLPRT